MKLYLLALSCLLGACHKGCSPFYELEDVLREVSDSRSFS